MPIPLKEKHSAQPPDIGDIAFVTITAGPWQTAKAPKEMRFNSGDEVALADDAKGESKWQGKMADRCHPLTILGCKLLAASNAFFNTSKWFHAPDGRPPAQPFTSRHANVKPSCK